MEVAKTLNSWKCDYCGNINLSHEATCRSCAATKVLATHGKEIKIRSSKEIKSDFDVLGEKFKEEIEKYPIEKSSDSYDYAFGDRVNRYAYSFCGIIISIVIMIICLSLIPDVLDSLQKTISETNYIFSTEFEELDSISMEE